MHAPRQHGASLPVLLVACLVLAGALPGPAAATSAPGEQGGSDRAGCRTKPIAHRGEHQHHDENTLGALTAVRHTETDLRVTRDGRFVLMHDRRLDRTTDGTGLVDDRSWRYIHQLRTEPRGKRVPLFSQLLDAIARKGTHVAVEVKSFGQTWTDNQLRAAARMVRRHGLVDQVRFGGLGVLDEMEAFAPRLTTYWRPARRDEINRQTMRAHSVETVLVLPDRLTRRLVDRMRAAGYTVWVRRGRIPPGSTRQEYWRDVNRVGAQRLYTDQPYTYLRWCRDR